MFTKMRGLLFGTLAIVLIAGVVSFSGVGRSEQKGPTKEQKDAAALCDLAFINCRKACEDAHKGTSKVFSPIKACYARCAKTHKACVKKAMAREMIVPGEGVEPSGVAP